MRTRTDSEEAIGSLLAAGLLDEAEADWLRQRSAAAPRAAWRVVDVPVGPAPSVPAADPDPYETFSRGAARLAGGLANGLRAVPWRPWAARSGVALLIVLVAVFWVLLGTSVIATVPAPWDAALFLVAAGALFGAGHIRMRRMGDSWAVAGVALAAVMAILAVAVAAEPFTVLVTGCLAGLALALAGWTYRAQSSVLSVIPVLALPWLVLRVTAGFEVPGLPVLVSLSFVVLALAFSVGAPVLVSPPRRRYAWGLVRAEALLAASFAVLMFLLPATLASAGAAGEMQALGIPLLLAATFALVGVRTRSFLAIALGLALMAVAPVLFLLLALGPFGWLLIGAGLGALGVGLAARRSARRRAALTRGDDAAGAAGPS